MFYTQISPTALSSANPIFTKISPCRGLHDLSWNSFCVTPLEPNGTLGVASDFHRFPILNDDEFWVSRPNIVLQRHNMPVLKSQVLSWIVNEILTTCLSTGSRVVNDSLLDRKSNKPGETSITLDLDNDLVLSRNHSHLHKMLHED